MLKQKLLQLIDELEKTYIGKQVGKILIPSLSLQKRLEYVEKSHK